MQDELLGRLHCFFPDWISLPPHSSRGVSCDKGISIATLMEIVIRCPRAPAVSGFTLAYRIGTGSAALCIQPCQG